MKASHQDPKLHHGSLLCDEVRYPCFRIIFSQPCPPTATTENADPEKAPPRSRLLIMQVVYDIAMPLLNSLSSPSSFDKIAWAPVNPSEKGLFCDFVFEPNAGRQHSLLRENE
jgi:hypothetical protein